MLMANYLYTRPYPLIFHYVYATTGDGNESFTQLGSLAPASDGYLVLLAGNNSKEIVGKEVKEQAFYEEQTRNRDLLVMRIKKGFAQEIDAYADKDKNTLDVILSSMKRSHERDDMTLLGRTYITNYVDEGKYSASRPKMVRVADGTYIVIWERWTHNVTADKKNVQGAFDSTWAMKINQNGDVLQAPVKLSDTARITRGDEPVLWNGKATFLGGDVVENKLLIHTVDGNLKYSVMALPLN
jgi:hypothetical protein